MYHLSIFCMFIISCLMAVSMSNVRSNHLTVTSYNGRSLNSSISYLNKLMNNSDILVLQEHRLYSNELHKLNDINRNYHVHAKASKDLDPVHQNCNPGHCGIAMFWKKEIGHSVKPIECVSDRICGIEISEAYYGQSLFVIGVYLPHQSCRISSFESEISLLSDLVARLKHSGEIVIVGDVNCHFGKECGNRCWGKSTRNAKQLMRMVKSCNLEIIDLDDNICTGPSYTFHVDGIGTSYIDHCIVSENIQCNVLECFVLEEDHFNMSDHLPIVIKIDTCMLKKDQEFIKENICWHKLTSQQVMEGYTKPLDERLDNLLYNMEEDCKKVENDITEIIEKSCTNLVNEIHNADKGLPRSVFKPHCKPYWNGELSDLAIKNKKAWREWVVCGRPRGNHVAYTRYKEHKQAFRQAQIKAIQIYEQIQLDELTKSQEINARYFWYLVNKTKRKNTGSCPIKLSTGKTITNVDDITQAWGNYFEKLYNNSENSEYDEEHRYRVRDELVTMTIGSYNNDEHLLLNITEGEIETIVTKLANRKAPGYDGVTNEHIKYGSSKLITYLTKLFSLIVKYEYIPSLFKVGIIVPIPKGDKDRTRQDSYRGITLMSVIAKIFEKWVLYRIEPWAEGNQCFSQMQGASQSMCSSMHTTWLVRECIADNMEKGKNVYVGLLDIMKAFDSVWQDGLFHKLYKYGLNGKTWRILRYLFHNFKCMVRYGNRHSYQFAALQGIHQGSPTSMLLFQVFINELLCEINTNPASIRCTGIYVGGIAFADDVAIMSNSVQGLQQLANVAYQYSKMWRFQFNPSKCSVMQFGDERQNIRIKIGKNVIKCVKKDSHLGVVLTNKYECIEETVLEKIQQCKTICYATQSIGSYITPITPKTFSKVYWSVCVPKLCYGTEIMEMNINTVNVVESFHCSMAKQAQKLPNQCSNPGSLATLGWKSISAHCNFLKFIFLWQLLTLPFKCVYKEVCIKRLCKMFYTDSIKLGPLWNIIVICREYGIYGMIRSSVESGEYMTRVQWKQFVKNAIGDLERKKWLINCKLYKTLEFMCESNYKMCTWWIHAFYDHSFMKQNSIIVRMLLKVKMYSEKICQCCDLNVNNSVGHILFQCQCNSSRRNELWNHVIDISPIELKNHLGTLTITDKASFVLHAFNSAYIAEWKDLFDSLSNFIYELYTSYYRVANEM